MGLLGGTCGVVGCFCPAAASEATTFRGETQQRVPAKVEEDGLIPRGAASSMSEVFMNGSGVSCSGLVEGIGPDVWTFDVSGL